MGEFERKKIHCGMKLRTFLTIQAMPLAGKPHTMFNDAQAKLTSGYLLW
jgi:hypothetical protein